MNDLLYEHKLNNKKKPKTNMKMNQNLPKSNLSSNQSIKNETEYNQLF